MAGKRGAPTSKEPKDSNDCYESIMNAGKLHTAYKFGLLAPFPCFIAPCLVHLQPPLNSCIRTCLEPGPQKVSVGGPEIRTRKLYQLLLECVSTAFCSPAPGHLSNPSVPTSFLSSSLRSPVPMSCATY